MFKRIVKIVTLPGVIFYLIILRKSSSTFFNIQLFHSFFTILIFAFIWSIWETEGYIYSKLTKLINVLATVLLWLYMASHFWKLVSIVAKFNYVLLFLATIVILYQSIFSERSKL